MNNFKQTVEARFGLKIFQTCFSDVLLLETLIPILDPVRNPDADARDQNVLYERYKPIYDRLVEDYPGLEHTAFAIQGDYYTGGTYKLSIMNMPRQFMKD